MSQLRSGVHRQTANGLIRVRVDDSLGRAAGCHYRSSAAVRGGKDGQAELTLRREAVLRRRGGPVLSDFS
jgi:hypothetical protein